MNKLRILLLSDEVDKALYDHFNKDMLEGIDVIISCGDLPASYLTFLATLFKGPVLYVPGNHDDRYVHKPPEGCICLDDRVCEYKGVRFAGFGGCLRYKPGPYQYTQKEMNKRVRKMWLKLHRSKGADVLVTHAPAKGHHDGKGCHEGFDAFNYFITKYRPAWFFYGHQHLNYTASGARCDRLEDTQTVNAFGKYVVEVEIPDKKDEAAASPNRSSNME